MAFPRKNLQTTVYLTKPQDMALKALSKRTRVPVSEYIREGIDMVCARYRIRNQVEVTK